MTLFRVLPPGFCWIAVSACFAIGLVRAAEQPELYDVAALPCALTEAEDVILLASSDPAQLGTVVGRLMETNFQCALCIVPCATEPLPDAVYCVFACMHQRENRCDRATGLGRISDSLIESASVRDRDSIVRLLKIVEGP
jgi:hypothetical protein